MDHLTDSLGNQSTVNGCMGSVVEMGDGRETVDPALLQERSATGETVATRPTGFRNRAR